MALAQINPPDLATGLIPYQSYHGGNIDNINLQSGVLTLNIPIVSYPQRGGKLRLSFTAYFNSKQLAYQYYCPPFPNPPPKGVTPPPCETEWLPVSDFYQAGSPIPGETGFYINDDQDVHLEDYASDETTDDIPYNYYYYIAEWLTPDGAVHPGAPVASGGSGNGSGQMSVDGSGFYWGYNTGSYAVENGEETEVPPSCSSYCYTLDSNGIQYYPNGLGTTLLRQDANGNQITLSANSSGNMQYTDTTGRIVPAIPSPSTSADFTGCTGPLATYSASVWQIPAFGGSTATYKFCYAQIALDLPPPGQTVGRQITATFLQSIYLPNGQSWIFQYNSRDSSQPSSVNYGDLTQITLPTGGTINYQYDTIKGYSGTTTRWVSSRTINANDGTGPHEWQYAYTLSAGDFCTTSTNVTDPEGNQTVHSFSGCPANFETETQYFNGTSSSGTLLKTHQRAYQYVNLGQYLYGNVEQNVLPISDTVTWPSGQTMRTTTAYCCTFTITTPGAVGTSVTTGRESSVKTYGYGAGSPGSLLQDKETVYEVQENSKYLTANMLDLVYSTTINNGTEDRVAETVYGYDSSSYLTSSGLSTQHVASLLPVRGNRFTETDLLVGGTSPETYTYWYDTGEAYQSKDALANITKYGYDPTGTYLTSVTNALNQNESATYDTNTGLMTSLTDANSQKTQYSWDEMDRLTDALFPDVLPSTTTHGETQFTYKDSALQVEKQQRMNATQWIETVVQFDGFGRNLTSTLTDPAGNDVTTTTYDGLGRIASVSNPQRSSTSPTDGTTSYTYDALGRKVIQTQQDGSTLQWCYDDAASSGQANCSAQKSTITTGTWVDSTDENGNHWQQVSDALGRLSAVMEPNPSSNALALETDYTYDALNNLLNVNQKGGSGDTPRTARTFTYDTLSRLITSYNPETGSICYGTKSGSTCNEGYDANGNLTAKTDARGVVTNYTYDAINRMTDKTYPTVPAGVAPTSAVKYSYDVTVPGWGWTNQTSPVWTNVEPTNLTGRLGAAFVDLDIPNANVTYHVWTVYGYDAMGRTVLKSECMPQECGSSHDDEHFKYDLAGNTTFYDRYLDAGFNGLSPGQGYYYGGFNQTYDAAAHLTSVIGDGLDDLGANTTQNIMQSATYWPTGQLQNYTQLGMYPSSKFYNNRGWFTGNLVNCCSEVIWTNSAGYDSAGNVNATTDRYAGNWTYTYDHLNRIASAKGPNGAVTYTLDSFGNKTAQTVTSGTAPQPSYGVNSNNQLTGGISYDASGNVIADGLHTYTYDAEGRLYSVDGSTCYLYDADNDRVGDFNCAGSSTADYLYDISHRLMTQINLSDWKLQRANIYAGSLFVAEDSPDAYLTNTPTSSLLRITDQVGSLRARWDLGANWDGACTSFPYADGMSCVVPEPSNFLFTGKERDTESGLDYFGARYYGSNMGRFMSPDWSSVPQPVPFANLGNPQTLNLYSYVGNNPLSVTDPFGHNWFTSFLNGLANATYRPIAFAAEHPIVTGRALGNAAVHPIATARAIRTGVVTTSQQVMTGNPTAIGTAVGTVGMALIPGVGEAGEAAEGVADVSEAAEAAEAAEAGANYAGDNVVQGSGNRVNSDLPGGQQAAADKFNDLTKGQGTSVDPKTGQTVADDGTRLRNNANGTARIDRPASVTGGQHETIHYNNPD